MSEKTKKCPQCHKTKSTEDFYPRRRAISTGEIKTYLSSKCIECTKRKLDAWREENRDRRVEYRKKYYEENKERELKNMRRWKADNPEHIKDYLSRYTYTPTPEVRKNIRVASAIRAAEKRAGISDYPTVKAFYEKAALLEQKLRACVDCDDDDAELQIHVDHIIPVSMGGKTEPGNLQILSARENWTKYTSAYCVLGAPRCE